jgi:dihydroorotase
LVDFGEFVPERPFRDLVGKHLRPGDIYTHTYLGVVPMLDARGRVNPFMFEARKRGVIFDVGHGGGSFAFRQAVPAMKQGFRPDTLSTDLHIVSMNGGMKDLSNLMSKFMAMGMPLAEEPLLHGGCGSPRRAEARALANGHLPGTVPERHGTARPLGRGHQDLPLHVAAIRADGSG